jgi:hypothetical protein
MGQSSLDPSSDPDVKIEDSSLAYFPAAAAGEFDQGPLVVIARTPLEFCQWLQHATPAVQWIQVEGLLREPEVWATAARNVGDVALDVVIDDPATDYAALYRLVDVRNVRDVRVTIPVVPGFTKALRLAVSLHLPVRLLPGQPVEAALNELQEAVPFYLHDSMVETPVEFFHSCLASMRGALSSDLWMILEKDPNEFPHHGDDGNRLAPAGIEGAFSADFVADHLEGLSAARAECAECRWKVLCRGYFKLPDPSYSCEGVVKVFDALQEAADQMTADLESMDSPIQGEEAPQSN